MIAESPIRESQARWAATPIRRRLRIVRELRHRIAEHAEALACAASENLDRPIAEKLVSEVLPLADGCRWLERSAQSVLATRRFGKWGRPLWLQGVSFEVQRQPFGIVLVIGPGNYPLFLPAIHALQALVAGNAVELKPAPGTREVACAFAQLVHAAGLDPSLLTILPDTVEAATATIRAGVDKVIFTGSSENGRAVLAQLADTATPSVMELSGRDAVVVFADADLDLVRRALTFGKRLNGGETCMAPQRVIAAVEVADALETSLPIEKFRDTDEALAHLAASDEALGVSIFSRDEHAAQKLAARVRSGFVLINDLIAPTADPRMPFGGTRASGFGTTRGAEGLLEMTHPHVVMVRRGKSRPHFDQPAEGDAAIFSSYIRAAHGRSRLAALPALVAALRATRSSPNPKSHIS